MVAGAVRNCRWGLFRRLRRSWFLAAALPRPLAVVVLSFLGCSVSTDKAGLVSNPESPPPGSGVPAGAAQSTSPSSSADVDPRGASGAASEGRAAPNEASSSATPVVKHGIAWFEDQPDAAIAAAKAGGKQLVVDLWAPWCHTCLSMQNVVMTSENLPGAADRFVWLALDTERESNASWLERLPVTVWPTFYVVEPRDVKVAGRWLGAASPTQFARFLDESDRSAAQARSDASGVNPLQSALNEADTLAARGHHAEAAGAYASALRAAPRDWPRRPETLVAEMTSLSKAKDWPRCLELGAQALDQTGNAASAVDFSYYALDCADRIEPASPAVGAVRRAVAARLEPLCDPGSAELSPDDQADACDKLAAARTALGKPEAAREALTKRLAVLERAAAGKPPQLALTYDWARTDTLLQLGRPEDALALASEREQQLPDNYNPPHYRAKAFKALGRWQDGLVAIDRALSLAYGPRRIGLLTLKADLSFGAGRREDGLAVLKDQLAQYRALPPGQRQPAAEARVEDRLREVSSATAPASSH
jgi:tetratricopeptide (TPR) repeat protein